MSVTALDRLPAQPMTTRRLLGAYLMEASTECVRYFRMPGFLLPVTLFPTMFYLLFGIVMNRSADAAAARYLLASYGVFGVMSPGLFGFGVSLAMERENGLLTLKRAMPMPAGAYLLGKMAMLAAGMVMVLLLALALGVAHVPLSLPQALAFLLTGMLGVLPFCALGMLVGTLVKGQGAPGVINLIYLPMSFLSGLWMPLSVLPAVLQKAAPIWPSAHLQQLALRAVGMPQSPAWPHLLVLLAYAVGFFLLASRRLHRAG